jgi:hypothetical protein
MLAHTLLQTQPTGSVESNVVEVVANSRWRRFGGLQHVHGILFVGCVRLLTNRTGSGMSAA